MLRRNKMGKYNAEEMAALAKEKEDLYKQWATDEAKFALFA